MSSRTGGSLGWMYQTSFMTCRMTFSRLMLVKKNSSNTTVQKSSVLKSSAMGISAATWGIRQGVKHINTAGNIIREFCSVTSIALHRKYGKTYTVVLSTATNYYLLQHYNDLSLPFCFSLKLCSLYGTLLLPFILCLSLSSHTRE